MAAAADDAACVWTSAELAHLTNAIERHGSGDAALLTRAVRTKSAGQVQAQLDTLRAAIHGGDGGGDAEAAASSHGWYSALKWIESHGAGCVLDADDAPAERSAAAQKWDEGAARHPQLNEVLVESLHRVYAQNAARLRCKAGAKSRHKMSADTLATMEDASSAASVYRWLAAASVSGDAAHLPPLDRRAKVLLKRALVALDTDDFANDSLTTS